MTDSTFVVRYYLIDESWWIERQVVGLVQAVRQALRADNRPDVGAVELWVEAPGPLGVTPIADSRSGFDGRSILAEIQRRTEAA